MKSKLITITFLYIVNILTAQETIKVETVQDSFTPPQFSTAYDDVFMNHRETKWLVKVDWIGLLGAVADNDKAGNIYNYGIEFEKKIFKNISLNIGATTTRNLYDIIDGRNEFTSLKFYFEPRLYFNMKKNIEENKISNNLNGDYIGLQAGFFRNIEGNGEIYYSQRGIAFHENELPVFHFSANYGIQKRIFNTWYINYRFGAQVVENEDDFRKTGKGVYYSSSVDYEKWRFSLNNHFTIGLAFGGGKKKGFEKCDIFRCFEEEKNLLKFNLRNLFGNFTTNQLNIGLGVAYEKKIGKSPFSINGDIFSFYKKFELETFLDGDRRFFYGFTDHVFANNSSFGFNSNRNAYLRNFGNSLSFEPRFYYNLRRRIVKGNSANNLSGSYIALSVRMDYKRFEFENILGTGDKKFIQRAYFLLPKWGIQKRIFKNGYFDFNLSPIFYANSEIKGDKGARGVRKNNLTKLNEILSEFKLGLAF